MADPVGKVGIEIVKRFIGAVFEGYSAGNITKEERLEINALSDAQDARFHPHTTQPGVWKLAQPRACF